VQIELRLVVKVGELGGQAVAGSSLVLAAGELLDHVSPAEPQDM